MSSDYFYLFFKFSQHCQFHHLDCHHYTFNVSPEITIKCFCKMYYQSYGNNDLLSRGASIRTIRNKGDLPNFRTLQLSFLWIREYLVVHDDTWSLAVYQVDFLTLGNNKYINHDDWFSNFDFSLNLLLRNLRQIKDGQRRFLLYLVLAFIPAIIYTFLMGVQGVFHLLINFLTILGILNAILFVWNIIMIAAKHGEDNDKGFVFALIREQWDLKNSIWYTHMTDNSIFQILDNFYMELDDADQMDIDVCNHKRWGVESLHRRLHACNDHNIVHIHRYSFNALL